MKIIFKLNQIQPGIILNIDIIGIQPPKKSTVINAEIKIILLYSAKKKKTKTILEYSTYILILVQILLRVNQMVFY